MPALVIFIGQPQLFSRALAYADDLVLLAPTASPMRRISKLRMASCEDYAADFQVSFNLEKTKCVLFTPRRRHGAVCCPCGRIPARKSSY